MAHNEQKKFVENLKKKAGKYFKDQFVLEIGSLNINGTVRDFFEKCSYVGVDVGPGDGVDVVCEGQKYNAPDNAYDVVCSLECFEHNPYWLETFVNMVRLCRPGGLVFFTCASDGRAEHGTTRTRPEDSPLTVDIGWDYYRNLNESDFREHINFEDHFDYYYFEVNHNSKDLYFWGLKKTKESEKEPIPVIGIPIVNGFHWIKRLIDSIDYPVDQVFIFDNNGRGELTEDLDNLAKENHPFINQIKVCHLPANIGVSGSWNMTIKCGMNAPYWIISNHDVAFTPGFLENMLKKAKDLNVGMVHGNRGAWDIFLLKDWVVQECGLFDENCYPAYVEDVDYYIRTMLYGIKRVNVEYPYLHGEKDYETTGSQTWRVDRSLESKMHHSRILNEMWYIYYKWGPHWHTGIDWVNTNPYKYPFNNDQLPLSYTFYNLDFVRQKHLGF